MLKVLLRLLCTPNFWWNWTLNEQRTLLILLHPQNLTTFFFLLQSCDCKRMLACNWYWCHRWLPHLRLDLLQSPKHMTISIIFSNFIQLFSASASYRISSHTIDHRREFAWVSNQKSTIVFVMISWIISNEATSHRKILNFCEDKYLYACDRLYQSYTEKIFKFLKITLHIISLSYNGIYVSDINHISSRYYDGANRKLVHHIEMVCRWILQLHANHSQFNVMKWRVAWIWSNVFSLYHYMVKLRLSNTKHISHVNNFGN